MRSWDEVEEDGGVYWEIPADAETDHCKQRCKSNEVRRTPRRKSKGTSKEQGDVKRPSDCITVSISTIPTLSTTRTIRSL